MSLEKIYKGAPIPFTLRFTDSDYTFDDLTEVICYVYTFKGNPVKFSKTDKTEDDYIQLTRISALEYEGWVPSSTSKVMDTGDVVLEVITKEDSDEVPSDILERVARIKIFELVDSEVDAEVG
jgi:hypothetical protein